ncbi:MAG: hypothetical protein OER43_04305 [Gammaproteobacteria bacterium]|nr:hypothetical protein [Gammaproteobacteria bacterium]MDH3411982.1 hypothetical protein [Gammaproteobacteria bacterium]
MLKNYFGWIVPACLCLVVSAGAAAQSQGLKKGPEISADRKSEQGLEHGNAYAGTREKKKDEEQYVDQDEMKKAKKDKAEKQIKEEKSEKEKVAKQEKEKLEKQKDKSKKKEKIKDKNKDDKSEKES